jgi:hypothetical protein
MEAVEKCGTAVFADALQRATCAFAARAKPVSRIVIVRVFMFDSPCEIQTHVSR